MIVGAILIGGFPQSLGVSRMLVGLGNTGWFLAVPNARPFASSVDATCSLDEGLPEAGGFP